MKGKLKNAEVLHQEIEAKLMCESKELSVELARRQGQYDAIVATHAASINACTSDMENLRDQISVLQQENSDIRNKTAGSSHEVSEYPVESAEMEEYKRETKRLGLSRLMFNYTVNAA